MKGMRIRQSSALKSHSGWFLFVVLFGQLSVAASTSASTSTSTFLDWLPLEAKETQIHEQSTKNWNRWRAGATAAPKPIITGISYYARVALAGGLAGATGTTVLYPMDSAKTLRQSDPSKYANVKEALRYLIRPSTGGWSIHKAYRGCVPAALGAIPSSALYFGAYETCKKVLENKLETDEPKWWIHGLAAASGNTISSAVFVPKEVLKQQMQYSTSSSSLPKVFLKIIREKGVGGLYAGYQATLMRNIPSAVVRFVLYEELKHFWSRKVQETKRNGSGPGIFHVVPEPVGLFAAGAIAGAVASGALTPVDVIKTRLATGTCPVGVQNCFQHIVKSAGWKGLYAGAGSRMMWSGAFSAIGFGTFELLKSSMGVSDRGSP